jgi:hypothetical protein
MLPTLDTTSTASATSASQLIWNHTVSNKPDRILLVCVGSYDINLTGSVSATYAGQTLTKLGAATRLVFLYLVNPPVGTAQIVFNAPATGSMVAWSQSFYHVHQTYPIRSGNVGIVDSNTFPTIETTAGPPGLWVQGVHTISSNTSFNSTFIPIAGSEIDTQPGTDRYPGFADYVPSNELSNALPLDSRGSSAGFVHAVALNEAVINPTQYTYSLYPAGDSNVHDELVAIVASPPLKEQTLPSGTSLSFTFLPTVDSTTDTLTTMGVWYLYRPSSGTVVTRFSDSHTLGTNWSKESTSPPLRNPQTISATISANTAVKEGDVIVAEFWAHRTTTSSSFCPIVLRFLWTTATVDVYPTLNKRARMTIDPMPQFFGFYPTQKIDAASVTIANNRLICLHTPVSVYGAAVSKQASTSDTMSAASLILNPSFNSYPIAQRLNMNSTGTTDLYPKTSSTGRGRIYIANSLSVSTSISMVHGFTNANAKNHSVVVTTAGGGDSAAKFDTSAVLFINAAMTQVARALYTTNTESTSPTINVDDAGNVITMINNHLFGNIRTKVVSWNPTSTGTYSVTGVGFKPSAVIHLGGYNQIVDARRSIGWMDDKGNQWAISWYVDEDNIRSQMQTTSRCCLLDTLNEKRGISFVSMDNDGFTVNVTGVDANNTYVSLCIGDVRSRAGTFTKATTAFGTNSISGLDFKPSIIFLLSGNSSITETMNTTDSAIESIGIVSGDGLGGAIGFAKAQYASSTQTSWTRTNSCFTIMKGTDTGPRALAHLKDVTQGSFTLSWPVNDGGTEVIGYLALGHYMPQDYSQAVSGTLSSFSGTVSYIRVRNISGTLSQASGSPSAHISSKQNGSLNQLSGFVPFAFHTNLSMNGVLSALSGTVARLLVGEPRKLKKVIVANTTKIRTVLPKPRKT